MKTKNRRSIIASIFILIVILLLSTIVYAKPFTDAFKGGLLDINKFFTEEGYKPYAKIIDFFFFGLLFTAIYMMGARYAFKEVKSPERTIVVLLGLMTAFLMVLAGFSATLLIPYIHWLLYTLLFIFYWWLLKGIKSKFWRFVLALLLTLLTIFLLPLLLGLTAPEVEGIFKPFIEGFRAIEFPELPRAPGIPSYITDLFGAPTVTPIEPVVTPGVTPKEAPREVPTKPAELLGLPWWAWLIIAFILLSALAGIWKGREIGGKLRDWWGRIRRAAERAPPQALTLQGIIGELIRIIQKKDVILKKIKDIIQEKKEYTDDLYERYHKVLKFDPAFWKDPDSEPFKQWIAQNEDIKKLLKLEFELEGLLKELMEEENEIINVKAKKWYYTLLEKEKEKFKEIIEELKKTEKETPLLFWEKVREWISSRFPKLMEGEPEWYKDVMSKIWGTFSRLVTNDPNPNIRGGYNRIAICEQIRRNIGHYFLIGKEEAERERRWQELIKLKDLENWIKNKDKWKGIENINADSIRRHFQKEESFFDRQFKPELVRQMKYMYLLIRYLKLLDAKRELFTEMQPLKVEYTDPYTNTPVTLTPEMSSNYTRYAIPKGEKIRVYARLAKGLGPTFKVWCILSRKFDDPRNPGHTRTATQIVGDLKNPKTITKTEADPNPIIEFTSDEFGSLLETQPDRPQTITFHVVSTTRYQETPETPFSQMYGGISGARDVPIAQKYRDVKSIDIHIGPAAIRRLGIRIISPIPRSSHEIGVFIDNLEAEAIGMNSTDINLGRVPHMNFVWYVEQNKNKVRLHLGRTGPHNLASLLIPTTFVPSPPDAKLSVVLVDASRAAGNQEVAFDIIDIILTAPTGPITPGPTPGPVLPPTPSVTTSTGTAPTSTTPQPPTAPSNVVNQLNNLMQQAQNMPHLQPPIT